MMQIQSGLEQATGLELAELSRGHNTRKFEEFANPLFPFSAFMIIFQYEDGGRAAPLQGNLNVGRSQLHEHSAPSFGSFR